VSGEIEVISSRCKIRREWHAFESRRRYYVQPDELNFPERWLRRLFPESLPARNFHSNFSDERSYKFATKIITLLLDTDFREEKIDTGTCRGIHY